jgi:UDP-glucose 4-epimerase
MATLVIGGCGFIGRHIVAALEERGRAVVVLDRHGEPRGNTVHTTYVRGEFGDQNALESVFQLAAIEAVVHLAASTVPGNSNRDPRLDVETNVCDTISLLDLCVRHRVRKVVFLSSGGAVYGVPQTNPVAETHPTDPISSYGITKLVIEKYLKLYHHLHGLEYVAIRAANPYGPGQSPYSEQGVVSVFAWRILHGQELTVWGDGSVVRDYFHVRDLADFCCLALDGAAIGVFNAGSGRGHALREMITILETAFGKQARVRFTPGRLFDVPRIVLDTTSARQTFAWAPNIGFEHGLRETRQWLEGLSTDGTSDTSVTE